MLQRMDRVLLDRDSPSVAAAGWDGTGRDGTGRDGTGWDGTAGMPSWEPASSVSHCF